MRATWAFLALAVSGQVSAEDCTDKDAELSPDATSYYVPSRCTSLWIDGDHPRKDMIIEAVEMHPSLTRLSLARDPFRAGLKGGLEADDILVLLDVLPNTGVIHLDLAFNVEIGDEGVGLLAAHLGELKLKSLNLQTTGITDVGLFKVAQALELAPGSPLEDLNIARNMVGKVGSGVNDALLNAVKVHGRIRHINDEGTGLKELDNLHGHAIRTVLQGECYASDWGAWSTCEGQCGAAGEVRRTRAVMHRPHVRHLAAHEDCPHELEDAKPCKVRCSDDWKTGMKAVPLAVKLAAAAKAAEEAEEAREAHATAAGHTEEASKAKTTKKEI